MSITKENILNALRNVEDPDLKKDLVTLNMIKDIVVEGNKVAFTVVLTTPACPMKALIQRACENAILHYVDKDAHVHVNMTANVTSGRGALQELLPEVRNIIAVASGKGGVGKSTIAANLAVTLARKGARVGLVDADIYGPSMPIMFGVVNQKPGVMKSGEKNLMVPVENHGVKLLSIGFFVDPGQAIPWRGPMVSKALRQLFGEAHWGELDYMIVDLPPGTGDIHLTLVSAVPLTGAIIVTTAQPVALADAEKGINMFRLSAVNVPVIGLVENMSYFIPDDAPDKKYYIFGKDGGKELALRVGAPLLGQVPLIQSIREAGDEGTPAALQDGTPTAKYFEDLAEKVAQHIAIINAEKIHSGKDAPVQV